jgi:hypothetical protein
VPTNQYNGAVPASGATHTANSGRGPSETCIPRAFPLSHCISLVLTRLGVPAEEWKKRRLPIRWDLRLRSLHFSPSKVSKTVTRSCILGAWLSTFCKTPLAVSIDSSTRQGPTAPAEAPWAESGQRHEAPSLIRNIGELLLRLASIQLANL